MRRPPLSLHRCERSEFWARSLAGEKPPVHDDPQPGYYRRKLAKGGPWVPVRIWIEQDIDDAGDLVVPPRVRCLLNGHEADAGEQWTWCCAEPITRAEYAYLLDTGRWAAAHAPDEPLANPGARIDLLTVPPPKF